MSLLVERNYAHVIDEKTDTQNPSATGPTIVGQTTNQGADLELESSSGLLLLPRHQAAS